MREIFKDKNIENQFRQKGYVLIPLVSGHEIDALKNQLTHFKPSDNFKGNQDTAIGKQSFHITFFDRDYDYKKEMFEFTKLYFKEATSNLLSEYKCIQANVFLKPSSAGFVFPHQNLTTVDEKKYNSISFWLPLQDTNFENGTVCLIPRSQEIPIKYRNTHLYWPFTDYCMTEEGKALFVPIEVKKGELLILDDRIIHYTPVNKSKEDRWVLHSLWAPKEAQIKFFSKKDAQIEIYDVEDDFWQYAAPGEMIKGKNPDLVKENDEMVYSQEQFVSIIKKLNENPH